MLNVFPIPESLLRVDGQFVVRWFWSPGNPVRENIRVIVREGLLIDTEDAGASASHAVLPVLCIPPLVNAHTHLEFSSLRQPLTPPSPFPDWIDSVIAYRGHSPSEHHAIYSSIEPGLTESENAGVGGLGEIATRSDTLELFSQRSSFVRVFREYLGLFPDRAEILIRDAARFLAAARRSDVMHVKPGLSPHAPYSVSEELFFGLAELARLESVPLAMHLAETREELELLTKGTGPFRSFLERRGLWRAEQFPGRRSILPFLEAMAKLPSSLAVHCNYLNADEIEFLGRNPQIYVIYCPRTHAYFQHSPHPWKRIQSAGGRVLLGTDSRASNPCLSLWKELQHVLQSEPLHQSTAATNLPGLLSMITIDAAHALGFPGQHFSQQLGLAWNAVLIQINSSASDLIAALRHHPSTPIARIINGIFTPSVK